MLSDTPVVARRSPLHLFCLLLAPTDSTLLFYFTRCSQLNALVLDYLVVEGYRDAAEEFLRETSLRGSLDAHSHGASSSDDELSSDEDDEDDAMASSGAFDTADKPDLSGIEVRRLISLPAFPACLLAVPVLNEPFLKPYVCREFFSIFDYVAHS